jgi:predicted transcriptional regulator of viral defense system
LAKLERDGVKFLSFKQALDAVPGTGRQVMRNTLSKLVSKGRLHRVRKGEYLLVPLKEEDYATQELNLVSRYYPEGYVSFLSALNYHGLTTQLPVVVQVVVTTPQRKHVFQDTKYEPVRLASRYHLGFKATHVAGEEIRIATKEKAILDCFLHPEYCGGIGEVCNAIKEAHRTLDWKSIAQLLNRMGNSAIERRLYFCLLFLRKKNPLPKKTFKGFRKLDPSLPNRGIYDTRFGLRINTDLDEETN